MTPGVTRLLLKVLKWVIVPIALLLLGYLVVGPHVLPGLAKYFIPPSSASAEEPAPTEQAAESKNK